MGCAFFVQQNKEKGGKCMDFKKWTSTRGITTLRGYKRKGLSVNQIARKMKCSKKELELLMEQNEQIKEALAWEKEEFDLMVEDALYKQCTGYTMPVKKTYKLKKVEYENGKKAVEEEALEEGIDEMFIAPSVTAQALWLKNRCPETWKDKQEQTQKEQEMQDFVVEIKG